MQIMKRLPLLTCYVAIACYCWSCLSFHHKGDISISVSVSDNRDTYTMSARYDPEQTKRVQECIDKHLGNKNHVSFRHAETDATITLDDGAKFYMKLFPGELKIKLNKTENSYDSYYEIKTMCDGIKNTLARK